MDDRILLYIIAGLGLWGVVALQPALRRLPISLPMVYVGIGWALFTVPLGLLAPDPVNNPMHLLATDVLTEFIVIVSLMSAGISIDRPLSWRGWKQVWPLIAITMPLTIAAVAFAGWGWLGLTPAAAILLGAVLSPTDPVLARSVHVGPPGEDKRDDVRFDLTLEAGINDGLAFPFTYLAIAAVGVAGLGSWTGEWFALDVLWRIAAGIAVGIGVGRFGGWFVFKRSDGSEQRDGEHGHSSRGHEGVVVMATLLAAYGLAEAIGGYGFLAVFVGAVTARQVNRESEYHKGTHKFVDELEDIVLVAMLLGFGGVLAGGILASLTLPAALLALGLLLVIRPAAGAIGMLFSALPWPGRFAVAFLGVRGMGTLYYLAYGTRKAEFADHELVWATASFAVLCSIVLHGITARPIMNRLEQRGLNVHRNWAQSSDPQQLRA